MSDKQVSDVTQMEGRCPKCQKAMSLILPEHYFCQHCQKNYVEQFICPICNHPLNTIKGCGAINYLCKTDGLISSSKIKFNYITQ